MAPSSTSKAPGRSPALGTWHIVFLIVAAAAPLSAMIGTVPLAFATGNGAGVPAAFVFAGLTLLCFCAAYAVTARRTGGAGGFYASVADGLGRPPAVGAGFVALLAYNCATVGLVGAFGYFTRLVLADHGVNVSWQVCAAVGIAAVALLGYREIAISARLLAVLMLGEIGILLALDVAILVRNGLDALPSASFSPHQVTGSGLGVSVMFAFVSFIGFESAALYGKEARNPRRSVPRATYTAAVLISAFYALTSWLAVGAIGAPKVRQTATQQLGDLFFRLGADYLGGPVNTLMQVLLCTSLFAAILALHSAANRYAQSMAADRLLPRSLGTPHRRFNSPHRASVVQSVISVVVTAGFALAGMDPYADMTTSMLGIGTVGIVALQAAAALSVLGLRRRQGTTAGRWEGVGAPLISFVALAGTVWLVTDKFDLLTGTHSTVVAALPWLLVVAAIAGTGFALWLRSARPDRYQAVGRLELADQQVMPPAGIPQQAVPTRETTRV